MDRVKPWFLLFVLITSSCTRPVAVTHWNAKGIALVNKSIASKKKNGWGYPTHNQLSRIVCFNKNCINRQETINKRNKYRFKHYKNTNPVLPPARDIQADEPVIALQQNKEEKPGKIAINTTQTFQHLYFETNKAQLNKEAEEELSQILRLLLENALLTITVSGHTDNVGDAKANLQLSQDRAEAVTDYLAAHGINKNRLLVKGVGSTKPVTDNDTQAGRDKNRRVEFVISDSGK
jgi:outer membrane protein OmpA-like peptidoglycan-associated protein